MGLFIRFEQTAETQPNKPAFIHFSARTKKWEVVTYKQLLDLTQRFSLGLSTLRSNSGQALSLTPGLRAAVMTPPSVEFFALAIAMLKFGLVPIVVDPAIGLKKLKACLEESQPDIFIGNNLTHTLRFIFGWGKKSVKHNLSIKKVENGKWNTGAKTFNSPLSTPHSPAAIIFTSGSTGAPKGVLYTHGNLSAQLNLLKKTFDLSPDEIDLPAFPLYALIDILLGVTSVIPDISFPVPGRTDPRKTIDAIQKFNVTNMFASPVVLEILASFWNPAARRWQEQAPAFHTLKRIITAGAPASIDLQKRFRKLLTDETSLFGIYGATEALPISQVESREIFALEEKTRHGAGVCLGKPVEGVTVRIIPITDEPILEWQEALEVESNVVGEITVQGQAVTRGYIKEQANILSKIKNGADIIHRMGDVGYFDEEGRLWYCGRKSQRVVTEGDIMFTEQIENIFNAHPSVARSALVAVKNQPVLWIEPKRGVYVNKDKIRQELIGLAKNHPQAAQIKDFLFMKKFPTDVRHNSKIIREELAILASKKIRKPSFIFPLSSQP